MMPIGTGVDDGRGAFFFVGTKCPGTIAGTGNGTGTGPEESCTRVESDGAPGRADGCDEEAS
jgi:hypothetical protein